MSVLEVVLIKPVVNFPGTLQGNRITYKVDDEKTGNSIIYSCSPPKTPEFKRAVAVGDTVFLLRVYVKNNFRWFMIREREVNIDHKNALAFIEEVYEKQRSQKIIKKFSLMIRFFDHQERTKGDSFVYFDEFQHIQTFVFKYSKKVI